MREYFETALSKPSAQIPAERIFQDPVDVIGYSRSKFKNNSVQAVLMHDAWIYYLVFFFSRGYKKEEL